MAALACMLKDLGNEVSGSDLDKHFFTEEGLKDRNIPLYSFNPNNIKDNTNIIIGNAFLEDFPEVIAARNNPTCTCKRYHEFVGDFIKSYNTIAIAGSHGKTTTTGIVSSMMKEKGNTGWLIGDGEGHIDSNTEYFCLEADEFRRHFIAYYPEYAIITNIEIDHVDYFKDKEDYRSAYEEFSSHVQKALVVFGDDEETRLCNFDKSKEVIFYGLNENDDLVATNVIEDSTHMEFDVTFKGDYFGHFNLPFVGHHLLFNSLASIGIGILEGMNAIEIEKGISNFHGVKRRFVVEEHNGNIYIDDYAHHPTEVGVTIDTAKKRFPNQKLVVVFKPHRASRVLYFADEFAKQLSKADKIYLLDFTSIDDKQDGTNIDIHYLQNKIEGSIVLPENEEGAKILDEEKKAVFLFMSSKDIYYLANMVKDLDK